MAKIILNTSITTNRYGLHFEKGEAHTNNEYLINKLIRKGVKVEIEKSDTNTENQKEKTIDEMTIAELKEYATENNIEIPSNVKNKTDIIEFITNYKKDDDEQKNPQTNDGEEESDTNTENLEGEENTNTEPTEE